MMMLIPPFTTSQLASIERINSKLALELERLRITRRQRHTLRDYYMVEFSRNAIIFRHAGSGRELRVRSAHFDPLWMFPEALYNTPLNGSELAGRSKSPSSASSA